MLAFFCWGAGSTAVVLLRYTNKYMTLALLRTPCDLKYLVPAGGGVVLMVCVCVCEINAVDITDNQQ